MTSLIHITGAQANRNGNVPYAYMLVGGEIVIFYYSGLSYDAGVAENFRLSWNTIVDGKVYGDFANASIHNQKDMEDGFAVLVDQAERTIKELPNGK